MVGSDIFISYRREDVAPEAGRLYSSLAQVFGEDRLFIDTAAVEPAANWPREIEEALFSSTLVIVAIGPDWIRASDEWGQRRIDNRDDWTRREIEFALRHDKTLLPILFRDATMPPASKLPVDIRALANTQALQIRTSYWSHDLDLVIKATHNTLSTPISRIPSKGVHSTRHNPRATLTRDRKSPVPKDRSTSSANSTLYCSFCGKSQREVRKLVAADSVLICDECNDRCMRIIDDHDQPKRAQAILELCRISVEAQNELTSNEQRAVLRDRMQDLAGKIRGARRPRENDFVAGCRLVKVIGVGNFATVWLGRRLIDAKLRQEETTVDAPVGGERQTVAVKLFDQDKLAIGLMLWRFQRGIRAMSHLSSLEDNVPNSIVDLLDVASDGLSFCMRYLPGGDLERIRDFGWSRKKKLSCFKEIASAVDFAHRNGIVHRDIKPANIVLDEKNRPVLTDFDIADLHFAAPQSMSSTALGTPQFAAPEQLIENALIAKPTADIYSLGKLLYFVFEERPPPLGSTEQNYCPQYLAEVHDLAIREAIAKCIRYKPGERFQSVTELLRQIPD